MTIRLASYNIHKGVGLDRRCDPERIIAVLNEIDADVIALQEADKRFGARSAILSPRLLEQHSDLMAVPLDVQNDSMGWHGNVILVRKGAEVRRHDILHIPCLEPRGAVVAEVVVKGQALSAIGMHLDLSGLWRRRQARAILAIAERESAPVVLMGDMNEWRPAAGCLHDFGRQMKSAPVPASFPGLRPIGRLDRIFHDAQLALVDCGVHATQLARRASDHLPIWAEFAAA